MSYSENPNVLGFKKIDDTVSLALANRKEQLTYVAASFGRFRSSLAPLRHLPQRFACFENLIKLALSLLRRSVFVPPIVDLMDVLPGALRE